MANLGEITQKFYKTTRFFGKPMHHALGSLSDIFEGAKSKGGGDDELTRRILALFSAVIWANGRVQDEELREVRGFFSENYPERRIDNFIDRIKDRQTAETMEAAKNLSGMPDADKASIIVALIAAANADGDYSTEERKVISDIAFTMAVSSDTFAELENQFLERKSQRDKILKSGAGIIAATVVIGIFVLTATFLKSVLFGLLLAYFFQPIQNWFQKKFFKWSLVAMIVSGIRRFFGGIGAVPKKVKGRFIKDYKPPKPPSDDEVARRELESEVNRACNATIISLALGFVLLVTVLGAISARYVTGVGYSIRRWADETVQRENVNRDNAKGAGIYPHSTNTDSQISRDAYLKSFISVCERKLESFRPKMQKLPGFKWAKAKVADFLKDQENWEDFAALVLSKSGGFFSATAGFLGNVFATLLNIALTLFFFSFFLQKIALSNARNKKRLPPGDYLINVIFNSNWLPHTDNETRAEAQEILNVVLFKLRTWIRGYFSIIFIETLVYVFAFLLLGVPYAIPLGCVAGCTVLLPFIGPILSGALTVIVCFAVGGNVSMLLIACVIMLYLIMNGILEQLFLYPALVGEALGLNTLETIIIVLLGGLFAGLPGMIFAVPAASVLKYLIPKIYNCWQ